VLSNRELNHEGQVSIGKLYFRIIFGPEQDICFIPLYSSPWLNVLSLANLSLKLLVLCLGGDR
jgi:hypothetical protein